MCKNVSFPACLIVLFILAFFLFPARLQFCVLNIHGLQTGCFGINRWFEDLIPVHSATPCGSLTVDCASCYVVATCARHWAYLGFYLPRWLRGRYTGKPVTSANVGGSAQSPKNEKPSLPADCQQRGSTPLPLDF